jgi:hypothetical protein
MTTDVIPVHADVQAANEDRLVPNFLEGGGEPFSKKNPSALDSDQGDFAAILVAFGNFVGDTGQGAPNGSLIHDKGGLGHKKIESAPAGSQFDDQNV